VPDSPVWFQARFPSGSGFIVGWVSAQYISGIARNGQPIAVTEIPLVTTAEVGFIEGNVSAPATATGLPGIIATVTRIDAGANLQLRRDPSSTAESLGLIPANTQLPVLGRNGDGNWLRVTFNGTEGWVNTAFITLTRDGRPYRASELTNLTDEPDIAASVTPGPSPTATLAQ
jgi:hypothetical protein